MCRLDHLETSFSWLTKQSKGELELVKFADILLRKYTSFQVHAVWCQHCVGACRGAHVQVMDSGTAVHGLFCALARPYWELILQTRNPWAPGLLGCHMKFCSVWWYFVLWYNVS